MQLLGVWRPVAALARARLDPAFLGRTQLTPKLAIGRDRPEPPTAGVPGAAVALAWSRRQHSKELSCGDISWQIL